MSEVWNRVYSSDNGFFGEEPSTFALLCFDTMKTNGIGKVLELGVGHGRDSIFFASNGIRVEALDYSTVAVDILKREARKRRLAVNAQVFNLTKSLPFPDGSFDAVYSHMLLNMRFSVGELRFIFSEIRRVLRPKGFNFFSVRNQNDKLFGNGIKVDDGIYEINGFQVRFFSKQEIRGLTEGFEVLWIKEEYEEPVTLYLVSNRKT
jgi:SAM-dependent methyltransferase